MNPDEWLVFLAEKLQRERLRVKNLKCWIDGDSPIPTGSKKLRAAYSDFQRKARTNFAELVVDAAADRMQLDGFQVGDSEKDDDELRRIIRKTHLTAKANDIHRDMLGLSASYAFVGGEKDDAYITCESPLSAITEVDPLRRESTRAALKVWVDQIKKVEYASILTPGLVTVFERELLGNSSLGLSQGWRKNSESKSIFRDAVPVFTFNNKGGKGEFEPHLDLLERINYGVLQRLVIITMQAYRQRAVKVANTNPVDESGSPVDIADQFRDAGAGAMWVVPHDTDIWESQVTDIRPLLDSVHKDLAKFAAVTGTPLPMLAPDSANQSAEGASFTREGLTFRVKDRLSRVAPAWDCVGQAALAVSRGVDFGDVPEVRAVFAPVEAQSLSERAAAAAAAVGAGVPWRERMRILGYSGDEIDRMEIERISERLEFGIPDASS